jgi:hypothetical protein
MAYYENTNLPQRYQLTQELILYATEQLDNYNEPYTSYNPHDLIQAHRSSTATRTPAEGTRSSPVGDEVDWF